MKKKSYVTPQIRCVQMRKTQALCNSPIPFRITSKRRQDVLDMELKYGGIDTDGNLDPD